MSNEAVKLYEKKLEELGPLIDAERKAHENNPFAQLVDDRTVHMNIACAVANQGHYNQHTPDAKMPKFLKQLSIPSMLHTLAGLPHEIISLQALRDSKDFIYNFDKAGEVATMHAKEVVASTDPMIIINDVQQVVKEIPQKELAMHCVELSINMTDKTTDGILEQLVNHAATQLTVEFTTPENLLQTIRNASDILREKIGRCANFIVMPVLFARMLKKYITSEYDFDALPINIKRIGYLQNKMVLFINGYERTNILMGYRGCHPADAGWVFAPYLSFFDPIKEEKQYIVQHRAVSKMVRKDYFVSLEMIPSRTASAMARYR